MEDALIEILESLGFNVYRQGAAPQEYDDTFFTFWNNTSPDHAHYDNLTYGTAWVYTVCCYSVDAGLVYSLISDARTALKAAGWIIPGKGYDVQSDEETHVGRGLEAVFLEFE